MEVYLPAPMRYGSPGSAHGPYIGCPLRMSDPQFGRALGSTVGCQVAGVDQPVWLESISFDAACPAGTVVVHGCKLIAPVPNFEHKSLVPPGTAKPDGPTTELALQVRPLYGSQMVVRSCMTMSPLDRTVV